MVNIVSFSMVDLITMVNMFLNYGRFNDNW
jgi:hypothetical protein